MAAARRGWRISPSGAAVTITLMILWTAFGSVFALLLGYSRIPYAAAVQGDFFGVAQITIVGHALVMIVRHQIENIFFEIRSRRADAVHFSLANHFRERNSQLRRAHRSRHRQEHLSASRQMRDIRLRSVNHNRCIEVSELVLDEVSYAHVRLFLRSVFTENIFLAQILCYTRPCFKRRTRIL